jgi:hypothetical protein
MAHDPSGNVDSDSADIAVRLLNRPHVETAPDLQIYLTHGVPYGSSAEDRWGWFVEKDQETVACGGDFATAEASKLSSNSRVVSLE